MVKDEEWVQGRISEAVQRFVDGPNIIQPMMAHFHHGEVLWQRKTFLEVVGGLTGIVQNAKTFGLAALGVLVMLAALLAHDDSPWYADATFTFFLSIAAYMAIATDRGYRLAFAEVNVFERRDYTDPAQVTGHVTVWLPRLFYYDRNDVWAGSDGESGLLDHDAYIMLTLPERQRLSALRHPDDYRSLPADKPTLEGTNPRMRRTILRSLAANGSLTWLIKQLRKQNEIKLWVWALAGGGIILAGMLMVMFSGSGAPQG